MHCIKHHVYCIAKRVNVLNIIIAHNVEETIFELKEFEHLAFLIAVIISMDIILLKFFLLILHHFEFLYETSLKISSTSSYFK